MMKGLSERGPTAALPVSFERCALQRHVTAAAQGKATRRLGRAAVTGQMPTGQSAPRPAWAGRGGGRAPADMREQDARTAREQNERPRRERGALAGPSTAILRRVQGPLVMGSGASTMAGAGREMARAGANRGDFLSRC
jgi:hypothetical protein